VGFIEEKLHHVAATVALEGERTRAALSVGLEETQRGLRVDGAGYKPVAENRVNYSGSRRLLGWSLRAATADVLVTLHDGRDTSGDVIAAFTVQSAGAGSTVPLPHGGVTFVEGLYVETTTTGGGTLTGAFWYGP
jgi:hypothetical protein